MENEGWQSAVKALAESQKELSEKVGKLHAAVLALSESSSRSPAPQTGQQRRESESSETGNDHRMTFEDFANEVGMRF